MCLLIAIGYSTDILKNMKSTEKGQFVNAWVQACNNHKHPLKLINFLAWIFYQPKNLHWSGECWRKSCTHWNLKWPHRGHSPHSYNIAISITAERLLYQFLSALYSVENRVRISTKQIVQNTRLQYLIISYLGICSSLDRFYTYLCRA